MCSAADQSSASEEAGLDDASNFASFVCVDAAES